MKIVDLKTTTFVHKTTTTHDEIGMPRVGAEHDVYQTLLTVVTDEGAEGYAFGASPNIVEQVVKPILIGQDPFDRELLWQRMAMSQAMNRDFIPEEVAVVDMALWDLAGRYLGQPVYKLLGGYRDRVLAYASTGLGTAGDEPLNTPESYAELAKACVDRGFKGFKLHTWMPPTPTWDPDPKRDIEACAAVRDAVGSDVELMLDCWHFYSREQALYIGREIEKLDYYWLEEPMDEYSISSYKWLADQLDIPVLGPERAHGNHKVRAEWIVQGACDILRACIGHCGGITPVMKIVHLAESFGVSVEMHGPGVGKLQVLGSMGIDGKYLEINADPSWDSAPPPWLNSDIEHMDADGYVPMPTGPGLGQDINFDFVRDASVEPPATMRLQRQR